MRDRTNYPVAHEDDPSADQVGGAAAQATDNTPMKLTEDDIRKLVEVFLILDRRKREDDEKAAAERAGQFTSCASAQKAGEGLRR
jgi:hypothetical protein